MQVNGHVGLGLFSIVDIAKDEEISIAFDTPTSQIDYTISCPCGSPECPFSQSLLGGKKPKGKGPRRSSARV
jgi:hypothetical protein